MSAAKESLIAAFEIELGEQTPGPEQSRWASIKLNGVTVFQELVYDTREAPAEQNIINLFGHRLRRLLEDE